MGNRVTKVSDMRDVASGNRKKRKCVLRLVENGSGFPDCNTVTSRGIFPVLIEIIRP